MSAGPRRAPRALLAAALLAGAAAAALALANEAPLGAAAATLVAAAGAHGLLRPAPRALAAAAALAALGACVLAVLATHRALRGEGGGRIDVVPRRPPVEAALARAAADPRLLRVAVWSDCRGDAVVFGRVLEAIERWEPAFHVGLGDLVGMARPYQHEVLRRRLDALSVPGFVLPGNHDRDPDGSLDSFRSVFGEPGLHLRTDAAVVVGLDTSAGLVEAEVARAEAALSEEALDRGGGRPPRRAILLVHHPLFPPAGRRDKALPDGPLLERLRALARARRATVLAGNYHGHDVLDLGGHVQVVTGGAGSKPEGDGPFHYVRLEVAPDGVRVAREDVAPQADASAARHRWRTLADEAPYAPRVAPVRTALAFLALALALGGGTAALRRRDARRPVERIA